MHSSESQFKFHIGYVYVDTWAVFSTLSGYILKTFRQCCQIGRFFPPYWATFNHAPATLFF